MHILLISDTYKLIDGVSTHVSQEEHYFKSQGHAVTVVSTCTPYTTNYYLKRFKPHYQCFDANPKKLIKELEKEGPFDIIYSQCLQPQGLYFSLLMSGTFGLPIVNRFHSYVPDYFEYAYPRNANRFVRWIFKTGLTTYLRKCFKSMSKVLLNVPNHRLLSFLTDVLNVPKELILVNHIPVVKHKAISVKKSAFSPKKQCKLLSVGRISHEKNFPFLVKLWNEHIAEAFPKASWTIVGRGPYLEDMKNAVEAKERVHFLGAMPHADVLEQMRKAELLLHSSLSETFGLVVAESKSCGLPIVALKDNAGVEAQFETGKIGGFLVEGEDEFKDKLLEILQDRELYAQISKNNQRDIVENYSTKEYDKLLDLFADLSKQAVTKHERFKRKWLAYKMRFILWYIPKCILNFYEKA